MSELLRTPDSFETSGQPSACAACGGDFECGAALPGCWCTELKITDEQLAELNARYTGCLCLKCLNQLAGDQAQ